MAQPSVFVTGGGRGIGRAIALRFAREGARVIVASRTSEELDRVAAEIDAAGGKGLAVIMNVADYGSVEAGLYRAGEFGNGAVDVLVNNAGIFHVKPIAELDVATWTRTLEVNLSAAFYVLREALPYLLDSKRPHVFNVASQAGRRGFAGNVAYCASKYGLRGLGDALREDLKDKGVRVSTVYPGATDTSIFDGVPGQWDRSKMNKPEDVAEVVWRAYNAAPGEDVADLEVPPRS